MAVPGRVGDASAKTDGFGRLISKVAATGGVGAAVLAIGVAEGPRKNMTSIRVVQVVVLYLKR